MEHHISQESYIWHAKNLTLGMRRNLRQECSKVPPYPLVTWTRGKNDGRNSGGIVLLCKNVFNDWISNVKTSPNFLWHKINKRYTKTTKDLDRGLYIPPSNSKYFEPELFEELGKGFLKK